jgi:hypothetical protein
MFLSVVIATLGGPTLGPSIEVLNQGSVVPAEILVCIPEAESHRVQQFGYTNVQVVVTQVRGQVAQRAEGFRRAKGHFVMQMDDDIHVAVDCVERLLETLQAFGPHATVAPALYVAGTGRSVYRQLDGPGWIVSTYYWLMNGAMRYQGGFVDKSCGAMGVDPQREPEGTRVKQVAWVPGGCVLQVREDLVTEEFFPFPGKAFCEDIIHSHLRSLRGLKMYVDLDAHCEIEVRYALSKDLRSYFSELQNDARARFHYARITGRSKLRLAQYYLLNVITQLARRLAKLATRKN